MNTISHEEQQRIWEQEHKHPQVLLQMDSSNASSGVERFYGWLKDKSIEVGRGVELGCGKGRNVIWLAQQGYDMSGIDFSPSAIEEALKRAKKAGVENKAHFAVQDATETWPFPDGTFDFAIDCFAMTDIESLAGRKAAAREMYRTVKPGGYVLVYALSTDDVFHKEMIALSPTIEPNGFTHPSTGKFEKAFDREELLALWDQFKLVTEDRIEKIATFNDKPYACRHYWMIFEK